MKFLIADDHALVRDGLRAQLAGLAPDVTIVEAATWPETLAAANDPALDLALVDLRMPAGDGLASLTQLLHTAPGVPVVVLSASEKKDEMADVLRLGAMGFIPKSEPAAVLLAAVRLVLGGGMYVPVALSRTTSAPVDPIALTDRQREVLKLVIDGKSNDVIATLLDISRATVKAHLAAVFRALDVVNRTQAAVEAERLGLYARSRD